MLTLFSPKRFHDRRREKGAAAIEFGLIAPLVMIVMFAIFEFGMAFWRKQILTSAAREGARKGVVATSPRKTQSEIETAVKTYLSNMGWDTSKASISVTGAQGAAGSDLTVTATYPTSLSVLSKLTSFSAGAWQSTKSSVATDGSGEVTLTATVVMQME